MKQTLTAALAALVALPATFAAADQTTGLVLAHDRKAHILILTDLTVWELPSALMVPADLGAGDRVVLSYETAGEDGLTSIDALERIAIALKDDEDGGS